MNAVEFARLAGYPPALDDLERATCPDAGKLAHRDCGCCPCCSRPRFVPCPCRYPGQISEAQLREDGCHAAQWLERLQELASSWLCYDVNSQKIQELYFQGFSPEEVADYLTP